MATLEELLKRKTLNTDLKRDIDLGLFGEDYHELPEDEEDFNEEDYEDDY